MTAKIQVCSFSLRYGAFKALKRVSLTIEERGVTAIIGPSGCGKSTLLRALNRMNDLVEGVSTEGEVLLDGRDIYAPRTDVVALRKRVGMVFQRPNPFPLSVSENILFGPRIHHATAGMDFGMTIEDALRSVGLFEELKDRLDISALKLSLEQQQRLCLARLLPVKPEVILLDEPCSALDPVATQRIEELIRALADRYTMVIVTHNMQQAARVSDTTAFMLLGEMVECGRTGDIFERPKDKRTEDYITGRYG